MNGLRLHWVDWGAPALPPLLALHGGGGNAEESWGLTAPHLADLHHVIGIDCRGHGESEWDPEERYGHVAYAEDLDVLTRALGFERFALMGF